MDRRLTHIPLPKSCGSKKGECMKEEMAMRALIGDEDIHHRRIVEAIARECSFVHVRSDVSTTNGAV